MSRKNVVNFPAMKLNSKISENLSLLMEYNHVNLPQLSKNTGLAASTLSRIKNDPDCNPTIESLKLLADFFGVTISQLIGDEPLPFEPNGLKISPQKHLWKTLPLLTLEQTLEWPHKKSDIENKITKTTSTDIEVGDNGFAIKLEGHSMEPRFSSGSTLIFDPDLQPKDRSFVLILQHGKHLPQFKQLFMDGADYHIKSLNPEFEGSKLSYIEPDKFRLIGVMVQARTDF